MHEIIDSIWWLVRLWLVTSGIPLLIVIAVYTGVGAAFGYTYERLKLWVFLVFHLIEACAVLLLAGVRIPGFLTSWTATKHAFFWPLMVTLVFIIWAFFQWAILGVHVDDDGQWVPHPKKGKNWWGKRKRVLPPLNDVPRILIFFILVAFVAVQISSYGFMSSWPLAAKLFFWMIAGAGYEFIDDKLNLAQRLSRRLAYALDPMLLGFVMLDGGVAEAKLPFGGAKEATIEEIIKAGLL